MLRIRAGRLIDGTGEVYTNQEILIENGLITRVEPQPASSPSEEVLDFSSYTVMPGLIDAHLHLAFDGDTDLLRRLRMGTPYTALLGAAHAKATLEAGVTAIRDAGATFNTILDLKRAVEEGLHPGPRMVVSGQGLSISGGHADPANGWPREIEFLSRRTVDGPDEARKAARMELGYGADCIKLHATGGVMSVGTDHTARGLTEEEMRAAVEEARNRNKRTLAHAQGSEGIKNALRAGVNSIEHGFWLDDEAIDLMLERGSYFVPTLAAVHHILERGTEKGVPAHAVEKATIGQKAHLESFRRALSRGVKIAMGTDAGTPFNFHGNNALELELMVQAGMTPMQAIVASTATGAELLQLNTGVIAGGYLADLLAVDGDPLADIPCLQDRERIKVVMVGGEVKVDRR